MRVNSTFSTIRIYSDWKGLENIIIIIIYLFTGRSVQSCRILLLLCVRRSHTW